MLLTQILSASPLAVPQLTYSTTSTRRDSITQAGAFSGRPHSSHNNNNHPQQQPQLIKKITNWSEKPPDDNYNVSNVRSQKQTKDPLIPFKSHFENLKRSKNNTYISRRSINASSNSSENLNIYFEKSFNAVNRTNDSVSLTNQITASGNNNNNRNDQNNYSNPIRLHSETTSAYFNDASILEAKKYNKLLQHYKNDKTTSNQYEMYQIDTTNQHQQTHNLINAQTEFDQKISHDFSSKLVVWIAAVIGISILGLVVGVLFGGPTTCLNQSGAAATTTTTTSTTSRSATTTAATGTSPIKSSSNKVKNTSELSRTFELIDRKKYSSFDIQIKEEQVSGSQDKRNSTCKPVHTVPMLSVQTPGFAGMERLGVPTRSTIASSTTRDERSRRRRETGNNETSSSSTLSSSSITTKSNQYNHHPYSSGMTPQSGIISQICPNSNNKNVANQYPHHVQLPDGEYGDDRNLQIRTSSQQSEIPRTYTRPPPNRSVHDVPAQLNYKRTSNSVTNIHEHFGSGRSIATSSNSTPVSKLEKSKHNSKIFSFFQFSSSKPNTSKSSDLSCIGNSQQHVVSTRSTNNNNNTITAASSSVASTATYSNNPHLESASSHLLNLTSLPVPQHLVRNPSDHLTVNNYPSISSINSSHHHHKPISCPTSPSSPIEQAASIDDAEDTRLTNTRSASSSDNTCILSSSLESPKSSMYM